MKNASNDAIANQINSGLQNANNVNLQGVNKETLGLNKGAGPIIMKTVKMANASHVMSAFDVMVSNVANSALQQSQNIVLGNRIGSVIEATSLGYKTSMSM
jgi:hypothetical protein